MTDIADIDSQIEYFITVSRRGGLANTSEMHHVLDRMRNVGMLTDAEVEFYKREKNITEDSSFDRHPLGRPY